MDKNIVVMFVRTKSLIYSFYYKTFKLNPYLIYIINLAIAIIIYIMLCNYFTEVLFCDSVSDVVESNTSQIIEDSSSIDRVVRDSSNYSPSLLFQLRRKLY